VLTTPGGRTATAAGWGRMARRGLRWIMLR
jgi:hypothetical protein